MFCFVRELLPPLVAAVVLPLSECSDTNSFNGGASRLSFHRQNYQHGDPAELSRPPNDGFYSDVRGNKKVSLSELILFAQTKLDLREGLAG